ncbi:hypothetical protein [Neptuniibacter sp. QD37_11]|uniref:hypothetical protein n=1 Tax=Neptuniibacter sp. QD37_11 TaxID=3398209 RepID=UPI0039F47D5D
MDFTEKEQKILKEYARKVDVVLWENRKNVPQSKYVIEVPQGEYYDEDHGDVLTIPDRLLGQWMMEFADDLNSRDLTDCLNDSWVRCERRTVITHEWAPI